ncbi:hypothetical protein HBI56_099520 [Parastagonospora nodorum]|nr:hypothetical protein HBI10_024560 [Parastagonospora nodorum]KAH4022932.1 hypothetical protein HBI13_092170 [Parastagonospora nodorum]KAH4108855.1 hypothetical protein HBH46_037570 [Parastagonospora nodorum]KAH4408120.1 hypothetical protein HBH92_152930 [Parastagonospora nodorum]KAH4442370.1 hypothetical protein HBH93_076940 [Parastagonospora nodorum]
MSKREFTSASELSAENIAKTKDMLSLGPPAYRAGCECTQTKRTLRENLGVVKEVMKERDRWDSSDCSDDEE